MEDSGIARRQDGVYCTQCPLARVCLPGDLDPRYLARVESAVLRQRTLATGQYLFRLGDPFSSLIAIRRGYIKSNVFDAQGSEHVLNFYMSGEIVGWDAIYMARHVSNAIALTPATVCYLSFTEILRLAQETPQLALRAFQMTGRIALYTGWLTGDHNAVVRVVAFLISLSSRLEALGGAAEELDLVMSREDIANHLRLSPETVSRILTQLQTDGLIAVNRRKVTLLDRARLRGMVPVTPVGFQPGSPG